MTDNVQLEVTPLVRVALHGEADLEITFNDLLANAHEDHDPATISDIDLIGLVETHMDINGGELVARVYGEANPRGGYDDDEVGLVVSRPATGNIIIRPETKLGKWFFGLGQGEKWIDFDYYWEYQTTHDTKAIFYVNLAIALFALAGACAICGFLPMLFRF